MLDPFFGSGGFFESCAALATFSLTFEKGREPNASGLWIQSWDEIRSEEGGTKPPRHWGEKLSFPRGLFRGAPRR